jgi:hypothetical protein
MQKYLQMTLAESSLPAPAHAKEAALAPGVIKLTSFNSTSSFVSRAAALQLPQSQSTTPDRIISDMTQFQISRDLYAVHSRGFRTRKKYMGVKTSILQPTRDTNNSKSSELNIQFCKVGNNNHVPYASDISL